MRRVRGRALLLAAAAATAGIVALPRQTRAAASNRYWVNSVTTGNWNASTNWAATPGGAGGAGVPGGGEDVFITQGDATSRNVTLDASDTILSLAVGNNGSGTNTLTQTSFFSLTILSFETIGTGAGAGTNGHGVHTQSSGVNSYAANLYVGFSTGSTGVYNLSGVGTVKINSAVGGLRVGESGAGTFNQSGGSVTLGVTSSVTSSFLTLGYNAGSSGVYNLSSGSLTAYEHEYVGYGQGGAAAGSFVQSGGTNSVGVGFTGPRDLLLGYNTGASGVYSLSGTSVLNVTGNEYVGYNQPATGTATGAFTHTSGDNNVFLGGVYLGYNAGAVGTYNLSGTGSVNDAAFGIGFNGTGTFTQSGGTHSAAINGVSFYLGYNPGSSGVYNLSGTGVLSSSSDEYIGYNFPGTGTASGAFVQSGGTHSLSTSKQLFLGVNVGALGSYTLSGNGLLSVSGAEYVGYGGAATFVQTGGTHVVHNYPTASLNLAYAAGSVGRYELSGTGVLDVQTDETMGSLGAATFVQSGGVHTVGKNFSVGQISGSGVYNLSGTGTFTVKGNETLNRVTFTQTAGTHTVGDVGTVSSELSLTGGSYNLSGTGSLTVNGSETVNGSATFNHSGGTQSIDATPSVEALPIALRANGIYNLSGTGSLTVRPNELVGLSFTQTGGTHTVGSSNSAGRLIVLNTFPEFPGTYALSGTGVCIVNGSADVGGISLGGETLLGKGELDISGGNMTVTDTLTVWYTVGTSLNLSGGTLNVASFAGDQSHFNWTGGTFNVTGPAGLTLASANSLNSVSLDPSKTLGANLLTIGSGGTLTMNGGTLNVAALALAGGTINGGVAWNNTGSIAGHGTLGGSGGFTNSGMLAPSGGVIVLSKTGALTNSGTLALAAGTQLQLTGGNLANSGVINLAGGTLSGSATLNNNASGLIAGNGTISATLSNNAGATLLVQGGPLGLGAATVNAGTINLAGLGTTLSGSAITNNGIIRGDGQVNNTLTNNAAGEIRGESGKWLTINAMSAANAGKINLQGGTVEFNAGLTNSTSGLITGRGTLRANAGLINNGQVQLISDFSDVYGTVTSNSGSKIIVSGAGAATFYNAVTANAGSEFRVSAGSNALFFGNVTGTSNFTGSGTKIFEGGSSSLVGAIVTDGETVVDTSATLTAGAIRENVLRVDGGVVTITPDGSSAGTSHLTALSITGGGKLDLTNNKLIVIAGDAGSWNGSSYSGMTGLVARGRNGSTLPLWDGAGVVTSQSNATNGNYTSLAIATAAQSGRAVFGGISVSPTDVLVMYTYGGDATLDGKINIDDYVKIDSGISAGLTGWINGDFNYDGTINIDDYTTIIDANIGNQTGVFPSAGDLQIVAVPEPAAGALLAVSAIAGLRRRRGRTASAQR